MSKPRRLSAVVEGWDRAEQCAVRVRVTWLPLTVDGVDHARDNAGQSPTLWGTENDPPVHFRQHPTTGNAYLAKKIEQVSSSISFVAEPWRVERLSDVRDGGDYFVHETD